MHYHSLCNYHRHTRTAAEPFMCSHFRAVQYFQASLNPRNRFVGVSCRTRAGGLLGMLGMWKKECAQPTVDLMGIWSRRLHGRFDFKTTAIPPYCIGCVL